MSLNSKFLEATLYSVLLMWLMLYFKILVKHRCHIMVRWKVVSIIVPEFYSFTVSNFIIYETFISSAISWLLLKPFAVKPQGLKNHIRFCDTLLFIRSVLYTNIVLFSYVLPIYVWLVCRKISPNRFNTPWFTWFWHLTVHIAFNLCIECIYNLYYLYYMQHIVYKQIHKTIPYLIVSMVKIFKWIKYAINKMYFIWY